LPRRAGLGKQARSEKLKQRLNFAGLFFKWRFWRRGPRKAPAKLSRRLGGRLSQRGIMAKGRRRLSPARLAANSICRGGRVKTRGASLQFSENAGAARIFAALEKIVWRLRVFAENHLAPSRFFGKSFFSRSRRFK
jgi:hypothetical protein